MNQTEKERQFTYVTEIGLCLLLIVLTALGTIPLALCIILCALSFVSIVVINRKMDDEL